MTAPKSMLVLGLGQAACAGYACMMAGVKGVSAFILAGGLSMRMGTDKALLQMDGITLLERAIGKTHAITDTVKVVGSRERYNAFGAAIVEDEFDQCGPLAGIHAALGASQR